MKYINQLLIFLLLINLFSIEIVKSNIRVSFISSEREFNKYITNSDEKYCSFVFQVLVVNDNAPIELITEDSNVLLGLPKALIKKSSVTSIKSRIFTIEYLLAEVGVYEGKNFSFINEISEVTPLFNLKKFTCHIIDSSQLSYSILGNFLIKDKLFSRPTGMIRVDGFKNYIAPILRTSPSEINYCVIFDDGSSLKNNDTTPTSIYYYVVFSGLSSLTNDGWLFNVSFYGSKNLEIYFPRDTVNNSTKFTITTSPTNLINPIQLFGTFSTPILSIQTENNIFQVNPATWSFLFPIMGGGQSESKEITYFTKIFNKLNLELENNTVNINTGVEGKTYQYQFQLKNLLFRAQAFENSSNVLNLVNIGAHVLNISNLETTYHKNYPNSVYYEKLTISQPFGLTGGCLNNFTFSITIPYNNPKDFPYYYTAQIEPNLGIIQSESLKNNTPPTNTISNLTLGGYNISLAYDHVAVFTFDFIDPSSIGLSRAIINNAFEDHCCNVIGFGRAQCIYSIPLIYDSMLLTLQLFDNSGRVSEYTFDQLYELANSTNGISKKFIIPDLTTPLDINSISSIKFKYNDVDTSIISYWNTMTVEVNDPTISKGDSLKVVFYFSNGVHLPGYDQIVFLKWDMDLNKWIGDFKMSANLPAGNVYYYISIKSKYILCQYFPNEWQLRVFSNKVDLMGPIFKQIDKTLQMVGSTDQIQFGWDLVVSDHVNGFNNGYVLIRGMIDGSFYNFTLNSTSRVRGDEIEGTFSIRISVEDNSISQIYRIIQVFLIDNQGQISIFKDSEANSINLGKPYMNPFINFMEQPQINSINVETKRPYLNPIQLTKLSWVNAQILYTDSLTFNMNYNISFGIVDQTGLLKIKKDQNPIVFLTTEKFNEILELKSIFDPTNNIYYVKAEIPNKFGFPGSIYINIYGIINIGGYFNGYSANDLKTSGLSYSFSSFSSTDLPYIKSALLINNNTKMVIYGESLDKIVSFPISRYGLQVENPYEELKSYGIAIIRVLFKFNDTSPVIVKGLMENKNPTNSISIIPTIVEYIDPQLSPITSTPTATPTTTNPTNPPQQCKGNPVCGGSKKGYCKEDVGCICYFPFIGLECSSQVIIVPLPTITPEKPETTIEIPNELSTDGSNHIITSIVSIIALREINSISGEQVNIHYFDKWIYSNVSSKVSLYSTNVTSGGDDTTTTTTTVKVLLEWFTEKTDLTFADEKLTMNPSTMKYTIQLSAYKFVNQLHHLQVVMSAQIQTNDQDDICSDKEFGVTTTDFSNYVKLQVSANSFYGRFIKRGIIDNRITTISNEILDKNFEPIKKGNTAQSFIGILIGNYQSSVIIDPDFSVLVDNYKANSNSPNSFCSSSVSDLSKGQLIGIIIGSLAFFVVIVIIISKIIYSSQRCLSIKIFFYRLGKKQKI